MTPSLRTNLRLARTLAALSVATAATIATACGGQSAEASDKPAEREIRRVHHVFLTRLAAGDADACDLLTRAARLALVNEDTGACFRAVWRFANGLTPEEKHAFSNVRVRRVTVRRWRATIRDRDLDVPVELRDLAFFNGKAMRWHREAGLWRIDRIG